jgi:NAD+ synthetase
MKIALIQINPIIGDFTYNIDTMQHLLVQARERHCDLAVFPELAVSGYPPQDLLERPAFLNEHDRALHQFIEKTNGIAVLCGAITRHTGPTGKMLHNSAILFNNGKIIHAAHKRLLPSYDVFDEHRYFEPAGYSPTCQFKGVTLGITICEDIWNDKKVFQHQLYSLDPVHELLKNSSSPVDLLINIAASPFNIGKAKIKHDIFANLCTRYNVPLIYVNQVGGQDSLIFDGESLAMNRDGKTCLRAKKFQEDMIILDTDNWPMDCSEENNIAASSGEIIDVYSALILGTRDYVKKCGFKKAVLGLSGGIDSALTAVIACDALGQENVLGIALPSLYSSKESVEDARQLAENLGISFEILPITDVFQSMQKTLDPLFHGLPEDVTEQNLQARIRGNLLMALANKQGRLVLSTGNKSEMAVGYCTLYGDMSGGLAVISDVPKVMVYALARYSNRNKEIIPHRTLIKPPSAELKPDQKDQDDLPPYEILDPILTAYLEENKSISEIAGLGFDREIVGDIVRRIKVNEYKRKQAPIGLKVTTKAFGYGRRYPTAENYRESTE